MAERNPADYKIFSKRQVIWLLLISNLFFIFLLLNIHRNLSNVKKKRAQTFAEADSLRFDQNPVYIEQIQLFEVYGKHQSDIVMLGSSFTQRVSWQELLQRNDVANRGVGSDVTEGYLHRLQTVLALQPEVCFVEAGANDIVKNRSVDTICRNMTLIVQNLQQKIPHVVLTKCFYVTEQFPGYEAFNRKADSLNQRLEQIPRIRCIDLNPVIAKDKIRSRRYALADGIHLNAEAYLIWKAEVEKVLAQLNLSAK
ncbi:MAG: hypothetical protein IT257_09210 [Chitinophagaceae bacterium]|nr:hypothetical protein [Chitinophagaceae bacterium]